MTGTVKMVYSLSEASFKAQISTEWSVRSLKHICPSYHWTYIYDAISSNGFQEEEYSTVTGAFITAHLLLYMLSSVSDCLVSHVSLVVLMGLTPEAHQKCILVQNHWMIYKQAAAAPQHEFFGRAVVFWMGCCSLTEQWGKNWETAH